MTKKSEHDLEPQQERFCQEYLKDLNAKRAAARAGYSEKTAQEQGSRLLSKVNVQQRVQELMEKRAKRVEISSDKILAELARIAMTDISVAFNERGELKPLKDIPKSVRRAIASVEIEQLFEGFGRDRTQIGYTKKVKLWDKLKALELLGKHLKLFTEKHEHELTGTLADLIAGSYEKKGDGHDG